MIEQSMQQLNDLAKALRDESAPIDPFDLPQQGTWPPSPYRIDSDMVDALRASVGSGRPLLVRGEPGAGKSHLARAAAVLLKRHFISYVVQPHSEYDDLLWTVDHAARLGAAQFLARPDANAEDSSPQDDSADNADSKTNTVDSVLAIERFVCPGPLWYAFDYSGVKPTCRTHYKPEAVNPELPPENGIVLLIDEIDKADLSLSNGLLEALGNGGFEVPVWQHSVSCSRDTAPLVVITSNDLRELPPAFVRRCVVYKMPVLEREALQDRLIILGETHFPTLHSDVLAEAAKQIIDDRNGAQGSTKSGQAEYLDLLRVTALYADRSQQLEILSELSGFFKKGD